MTRNARGMPGQIVDLDPATGTRVLDEALDYDQHGNVLAITDGATGRFQRRNRDMAYDGLDRLTSTVSPMFGTATYGHDVLDNLTRVAVTGGPNPRDHWYEYDGSNRLTNVRSGSASGPTVIGLGYDARGNVVNKNGRQFIFGDGNRLHDIAEVEHYRYDGLGRRVLSWAPVVGNILSQYDQAGRLVYQGDYRRQRVVDHVYLGARLVAQRERTLPDGGNLQVSYQHTDALGSAAAATDASRMVTQRSEYEPYGDLLNRGNDDRPGYTGHVMDAETGLTYMQQRYYDPGIGAFLSVDPVTAYGGDYRFFNRYAYGFNNPYRFSDPDGRCPVCKLGVDFALEVGIQYATTGTVNVGSALAETAKGALNPMKTLNRVQKLAEVYKGSKLARSMANAGRPVAKGKEQAHHVVAQGDKRAAGSREVLQRNGVDVNSADNGARMQTQAHREVHTNDYHQNVEQRLTSAEARGGSDAAARSTEVRRELHNIRDELEPKP